MARGSQKLGYVLPHLAQYLAPSGHPIAIFGINEVKFCSFLSPIKSRSYFKVEGNTMIVGNNNHLHIICMNVVAFTKIHSLLFFLKYVPLWVFVFPLLEETWVQEIFSFPFLSSVENNYSPRRRINGSYHSASRLGGQ